MRAHPRPPQARPFAHHKRPKWWHAAERECMRKRGSDFGAVLKWSYGERTPDEELWFGPGGKPLIEAALFQKNPFWSMIPREPTPAAPVVPVVIGPGWRR